MYILNASEASKIHASENEHGLSLPTGAKSPKGERVESQLKKVAGE